MRLRLILLSAAIACGVIVAGPRADAAETWTVGGQTFERVRVLEVTPGTVMIAHVQGMTQLDLASLPAELRERFHYDPAKAAAWHQEAAAGMAATEELRQRTALDRTRQAEIEEARQRIAQRAAEADPSYVEYRPEVDLRPIFAQYSLYLKNQNARPSCSIFAVVSALEYEYARRFGINEQLSEEYLVWAFQQTHPGKPINSGYNFGEVLETLRDRGVARRDLLPDSFASYRRDDGPPPAAIDDAATRRAFKVVAFQPNDKLFLSKIVFALNRETPVIIGLKWPANATLERNNLLKDQAPQPGSAHAVTLVGYRSSGTPESVEFIYRNSYGPQWGLGGYGLMAASYFQANVFTAFCLVLPDPSES